jgi:hypothetical protein
LARISRGRDRGCLNGVAIASTWETMDYTRTLLLAGLLVSPALNVASAGDEAAKVPALSAEIESDAPCEAQSCDDQALELARAYLVETARPGGTMTRQGPDLAIERLHPEFTKRLASAIRDARGAGLSDAGIFSAYRPPVFGVGGFANKYYSLHAYGLAVDMHGIGRPGSTEARQWHEIAAKHGIVCPYGYRNRVEWNHCQPTQLVAVKEQNPLRATITGAGPIDLERMFEVGDLFIADAKNTLTSVIADRVVPAVKAVSARLASVGPKGRKEQRARVVRRNVKASRVVARQSRKPAKAASAPRTKVAAVTKRSR